MSPLRQLKFRKIVVEKRDGYYIVRIVTKGASYPSEELRFRKFSSAAQAIKSILCDRTNGPWEDALEMRPEVLKGARKPIPRRHVSSSVPRDGERVHKARERKHTW
jgi:hypothetical protein